MFTDYDAPLCPHCGGYLPDGRLGPFIGPNCTCPCKDCEVGEPHVCPKLMYLARVDDRDVIDA